MFPIITNEKQQRFEQQASQKDREQIPCICGFCGRACRQMDKTEGANRFLCNGCPLAAFTGRS